MGAMALAYGIDLAGGRRCPVVPPRRAATRLCRVFHCVAALRVQPASIGATVGPLLPPTRHSGAGCGGFEGVRTMETRDQTSRQSLYAEVTNRVIAELE